MASEWLFRALIRQLPAETDKRAIERASGVSRTTVYKLLAQGTSSFAPQSNRKIDLQLGQDGERRRMGWRQNRNSGGLDVGGGQSRSVAVVELSGTGGPE